MAWRDCRVHYRSQGLPAALFAQTARVSLPNDGKPKRTNLIASVDGMARLLRALPVARQWLQPCLRKPPACHRPTVASPSAPA
ncbi:hypothetical protein ASF90_04405 [Xanthomonas sp. Leaf148]|nr:hypothetical protein ASF90_04405 [Xanthomonas sp. Leaf148]